jgi:hypothetical protein
MEYAEPSAGEWVRPVMDGYKVACCDCGLVHRVDFRVITDVVEFRVSPLPRSTAMTRRWMKRRAEQPGRLSGG